VFYWLYRLLLPLLEFHRGLNQAGGALASATWAAWVAVLLVVSLAVLVAGALLGAAVAIPWWERRGARA
jgi:hypothetical protein